MDERVLKLRTSKESEILAKNAERNGRLDIAEQAKVRGAELKAVEKALAAASRPRREPTKRSTSVGRARATGEALFINGVFEGVLNEVLEAQASNAGLVCYLQPYKPALIKRLQVNPPTSAQPWKLFMSLTRSLAEISFEAEIVEWHDKSLLTADEVARFNERISAFQPGERGIHLDGDHGRNLIGIANLQRIEPTLSVSGFVKVSDDLPLQDRTRAGGWSYVIEPRSREPFEVLGEESFRGAELKELKKAVSRSAEERRARLEAAAALPEQVFVRVKAFRRNQDVVVEVLLRANGSCEDCAQPAPFLRARDGTPFLEVHHVVTLAQGGTDTVANALALCPNCHRKRHYGQLELLEEGLAQLSEAPSDVVARLPEQTRDK